MSVSELQTLYIFFGKVLLIKNIQKATCIYSQIKKTLRFFFFLCIKNSILKELLPLSIQSKLIAKYYKVYYKWITPFILVLKIL